MAQDGFPRRIEEVGKETLVVMKTDKGYLVYDPAKPKESQLVQGVPGEPTCTCTESDAQEKCRHILAVEKVVNRKVRAEKTQAPEASKELSPKPIEEIYERDGVRASGNGSVNPQMLLKRSVSPDGRIDSLSVEFSLSVEKLSNGEIKNLAQKSLALQSEIVGSFRGGQENGNGNRQAAAPSPEGNSALPARIIGVEAMPTKWGRRLYLAFEVNGEEVRLFGSQKRLGEALVLAGYPNVVRDLAEGLKVSLPCRVTLSPTEDGRYMRIQQIFPAAQPGGRP